MDTNILKTDEEWKKELTPEQYAVMREKGTEARMSSAYVHEKSTGTYMCAACGNPLFASNAKFDSGTGWPSFDKAIPGSVELVTDDSHGMNRTEVVCARCHSHLGHVFTDGPTATGERYCMNGICLDLQKRDTEDDDEREHNW